MRAIEKTSQAWTNPTLSKLAIAAVVLLAGGCEKSDFPDLATGEQLYAYHCSKCHGEGGSGMLLKGITVETLQNMHLSSLKTRVSGDAGGMMPRFSQMPRNQLKKIHHFLVTGLGQ